MIQICLNVQEGPKYSGYSGHIACRATTHVIRTTGSSYETHIEQRHDSIYPCRSRRYTSVIERRLLTSGVYRSETMVDGESLR
jgi:hypothetical protein